MAKKKEEIIEEVKVEMPEDLEVQTTFNEDGFDVLCTEDTIIENVEEVE